MDWSTTEQVLDDLAAAVSQRRLMA